MRGICASGLFQMFCLYYVLVGAFSTCHHPTFLLVLCVLRRVRWPTGLLKCFLTNQEASIGADWGNSFIKKESPELLKPFQCSVQSACLQGGVLCLITSQNKILTLTQDHFTVNSDKKRKLLLFFCCCASFY